MHDMCMSTYPQGTGTGVKILRIWLRIMSKILGIMGWCFWEISERSLGSFNGKYWPLPRRGPDQGEG